MKKSFKTLVVSRYEIISGTIGNFKIPPKIAKNVKIDGDFSNAKNWKVKVILGNNANDEKEIGTWDEVGYVGFEPKKGLLIPIARKDEHHTGHDLLWHYMEHGLIPKGRYDTIWILTGTNYAWNEKEAKELIPVYKRWLELGGPNLHIDIRNRYMSFQDLVDGKLGVEHPKGTLSSFGKELIGHLEKLALLYKKALNGQRPPLKKLSEEISNFAVYVESHRLSFPVMFNEELLHKAASDVISEKKLDEAMNPIFGFKGIKNEIHKKLKFVDEYKGDPQEYGYRSAKQDLDKFFGDPKFALAEFNRISSI